MFNEPRCTPACTERFWHPLLAGTALIRRGTVQCSVCMTLFQNPAAPAARPHPASDTFEHELQQGMTLVSSIATKIDARIDCALLLYSHCIIATIRKVAELGHRPTSRPPTHPHWLKAHRFQPSSCQINLQMSFSPSQRNWCCRWGLAMPSLHFREPSIRPGMWGMPEPKRLLTAQS